MKNRGITLIALVITIIILLILAGLTIISLIVTIILLIILAGVGISLSLGENGLFNKAKYAKEKYINEQEEEQKKLNDLYSQMLVATGENSQITISVKELKELINEEVKNSMNEPKGIQTDAFIKNVISNKSNYNTVTSMSNSFTKVTDENNKIEEYVTYSNEYGYSVLKSGWYFVTLSTDVESSSSTNAIINMYVNNKIITRSYSCSSSGIADHNNSSFPIYLNKEDKIYFDSTGVNNATTRRTSAVIYPMF